MVTAARTGQVKELTTDQGRSFLEERVRQVLQIELDEFIQRWRAGAYGDIDDHPDALELAMLLPIVGVDPWSDGART